MALSLVEGIGPINAKRLVAYCGGAFAVFKEKKSMLEKIPGIGLFTINAIKKNSWQDRVDEEIEFIKKNEIDVLAFTDKNYPQRLKNCEDGPLILYTKGDMDLNHHRMISIVGTRSPSDYGKEFTEKFIKLLQASDVIVVSGLAYGIDITAHRASLQNGISTIGVVAHGLDRIYPGIHRSVAQKMFTNGGLVTEYMSDTNPDRENFPSRNRIVAGMCDATIVIETGIKGGSMITANLANDYNRDVFALPGRITDEFSIGCNRLIRSNRAALLESTEDFLVAMGWNELPQKKINQQQILFVDLNEDEKCIVNALKDKGNSGIDGLSLLLKIPMSKLSSLLLAMEFRGIIRSLPGKIYGLS